jgi:hypothetical protein
MNPESCMAIVDASQSLPSFLQARLRMVSAAVKKSGQRSARGKTGMALDSRASSVSVGDEISVAGQ